MNGHEGHIIEVLGFMGNLVVGRTWTNLTNPGKWEQFPPPRVTWFTPLIPGASRGAGATERFPLQYFCQGEMWRHIFLHEVTVKMRGLPTFIKRELVHSAQERPPSITAFPDPPLIPLCVNLALWDAWLISANLDTVSVYTDGSMRYAECLSDKLFMQPKSIRKATFAQGGLLFHQGDDLTGSLLTQSLTITVEDGLSLGLSTPSSIELYSILLAAHLLGHSNKRGTIFTDYLEAVTTVNSPFLLPIYELLLHTMKSFPLIRLEHIKAHGPASKRAQWTIHQWGNYHADRIPKETQSILTHLNIFTGRSSC